LNKNLVLPLLLVFLISTVSAALTAEVTTPTSTTIINFETTSFDITSNISYDGNQALTADIYLDSDTDFGNGTTETLSTDTATANGINTFSWNTTTITDGTYYIYIEATDGNQTGNDYSEGFLVDKTLPQAPADLTPTAGDNKIDLSWTASTSDDVKEYNIYRSTSSGFTPESGNLIGNVAETTYSDTNVVFGTTYYYIVKTVDNSDNLSADSNEVNSTPLDETPPVTTATGFTDGTWVNSSVTVELACDDGNGSGWQTTYYKLDDGNFSEYSGSFDITEDGTYLLEYYSTDNELNEETHRTAVIKIDSIAPTDINDLTATADGLTINLNWTASTDTNGSGIKEYTVYRDGTPLDVSASNSYSDSDTEHNTTYTYYVIASDYADNNSNASNDADATAVDNTGPSVSSNADSDWHTGTVTITVTISESDYTLYYKINGGTLNATTAINPAINFTVGTAGVVEGENSLEFWASDIYDNNGSHVTATIKIDNSAPNVPSLSSPGANSNAEVILSWSKPDDRPSGANSGVKGYEIWRKTSSVSYERITTINNGDTTSFTDSGRSRGTTYYYKIRAFDNLDHYSDYSSERSVTVPTDSGDTTAPSITWREPKNNEKITEIKVSLRASISDSISELAFVSFTFKKNSESTYHSIESFSQNLYNGYHKTEWDTTGLENGRYQLKVLGRDQPGNVNTKIINVTLDREEYDIIKDENTSDENKSTEQLTAETALQKAKDARTEATDLINYWRGEFNVLFFTDEKIVQANRLLEEATKALDEKDYTKCTEEADKASALFEEFASNTSVKVYNEEEIKSKDEEISLSQKLSNENEKLKKDVEVSREMQLIEVTSNGETFYQENFLITVKNTSDKTQTFQIIEVIPKELIETAENISSRYDFTVIESDPIISFNIELEAGEEKEIVYSLEEKITKEEANKSISENEILLFEGTPILLGTKTKVDKDSFTAATTGFFLFENILPIGAGIVIIIAVIGAFLFLRSRGFEFSSSKKEEETAVSEGLGSIYSQRFSEKRTLREEEPKRNKIAPAKQGEGGRFSYKGN